MRERGREGINREERKKFDREGDREGEMEEEREGGREGVTQ